MLLMCTIKILSEDLAFVCTERIPALEAEDGVEDVHTNRVDEAGGVQTDEMSVGHKDDMDEEQTHHTNDSGANTFDRIDIPFTEPGEIMKR